MSFPTFHFEDGRGTLKVHLMLKGGGCENVGAQYCLPDARLEADRDLEGVRRAVLDAVQQAQGKGCAPGVIGVGIGGDRGSLCRVQGAVLRRLDDTNPDPPWPGWRSGLPRANELGIGPMGFGGKTTVLGGQEGLAHRLPASYFVAVTYMCWATAAGRWYIVMGR